MLKEIKAFAHPLILLDASISYADSIFVSKGTRTLYLVNNSIAFRSYSIELGQNPVGAKLREGDRRTPEGQYIIDWRNPKSKFFLSLHINYPNRDDISRAENFGYHPGFDIMIHGTNSDQHGQKDWTHGCIAVDNKSMQEIYNLVADGTPIWIQP